MSHDYHEDNEVFPGWLAVVILALLAFAFFGGN